MASTTKFLYKNICCRFGFPVEVISNQGSQFLNTVIHGLTDHYPIVYKKSTMCYTQANGLAKLANKTLRNILKRIINEKRTNWDTKLQSALWAYQTSFKISTQSTPFWLAFGLEAVLLVKFKIPSPWIEIREHLLERQSDNYDCNNSLNSAKIGHLAWRLWNSVVKHSSIDIKLVTRNFLNSEKLYLCSKNAWEKSHANSDSYGRGRIG